MITAVLGVERLNESLELASREALTIHDPARPISDGDLEHVFGEIDGYGRRIHGISSWLISVLER